MLPAPVRVNVTEVTLTVLLREFVTEQAATLNCRVSVLDRTEHRVRGVLQLTPSSVQLGINLVLVDEVLVAWTGGPRDPDGQLVTGLLLRAERNRACTELTCNPVYR